MFMTQSEPNKSHIEAIVENYTGADDGWGGWPICS